MYFDVGCTATLYCISKDRWKILRDDFGFRKHLKINTAHRYKALTKNNRIDQCFSTFLRHGLFSDQYKPSRTQDRLRLRE